MTKLLYSSLSVLSLPSNGPPRPASTRPSQLKRPTGWPEPPANLPLGLPAIKSRPRSLESADILKLPSELSNINALWAASGWLLQLLPFLMGNRAWRADCTIANEGLDELECRRLHECPAAWGKFSGTDRLL